MGGSASTLRLPRVVLVGDAKQLDAVDAGKPFAQLQAAGMKTATMEDILRQKDPDLKAAVEASLARDVKRATPMTEDFATGGLHPPNRPENIGGVLQETMTRDNQANGIVRAGYRAARTRSHFHKSAKLNVIASKGRMLMGSSSCALAIRSQCPWCSSNASRVRSSGSTSHRCVTPSRA